MSPVRALSLVLALAAALAAACGGRQTSPETPRPSRAGPPVVLPDEIDEVVFRRARRALSLLPDDDPARAGPVRRLVAFQSARCQEAVRRSDIDAAAEAFDAALSLYAPRDLARGAPDRSLGPCADAVARAFSPSGDEARVASALLVRLRIDSSAPDARTRLDALLRWSREARSSLPSPVERLGGLIDVLEGIVLRIPEPALVQELDGLYHERHRVLTSLLQTGRDGLAGLTFEDVRRASLDVARTAYDLARIHVRLDESRAALTELDRLGDGPGADEEIVSALEATIDEPLRGLLELASIYGRGDPDTALLVCRRGRLAFPEDPRFAECLGQVSAVTGDVESAAAHYEDAMRLNPGRFDLLDQTLAFHAEAMEMALDDDDPDAARASFERADHLLERARNEWRGRRLSVEPSALYLKMGLGEFYAGRIDDAVRAFERSLDERQNRQALLQLGIIAERRGRFAEARRLYRRAIDLRPDDARRDAYWRALLLERLADSHAAAGERDRAAELYREALSAWDLALRPPRGTTPLGPEEKATAALRRAILFDRLGENDVAREAFASAIAAAPADRDVGMQLLSYLAARGRVGEALEVYRHALRNASLSEDRKIYYALWVVGAQRRGGRVTDEEPLQYLRAVAGEGWQERLARFYAGTLSYDDLLRHARTTGERAEAYFYQAVRLLGEGQTRPAADLLRQVIESDMMGFVEYDMAREILPGLR